MYKELYLIHAVDTDFYKVGVANWPRNRRAQLQTGCPYKLEVLNTWTFSNSEKREKWIHCHYKRSGHHVRGEWFKFNTYELGIFHKGLDLVEEQEAKGIYNYGYVTVIVEEVANA